MNKPFCPIIICAILLLCCKSKKKNTDENDSFFPVVSFIKSQVAHVDTSIYRITKIVQRDNTTDTSYLKREEFKEAAKDFLSVPDISSNKYEDDYEETKLYDKDLDRVVLNYMPKKADNEITREEVMIKPGPDGDKVNSIFINQTITDNDSTVQKVLFWEVDKRFRTVTIIQKPNLPEKKETIEVVWNDYSSQ
jgi:hypothetical protein